MELYSRYTDKDGFIYVVVTRWCKFSEKDNKAIPSTIRLLNVYKETTKDIDIEKFNQLIDPKTGKLKRVWPT